MGRRGGGDGRGGGMQRRAVQYPREKNIRFVLFASLRARAVIKVPITDLIVSVRNAAITLRWK